MPGPDLKRQNFNVTPEEEAQLQLLRDVLAAPSVKDAVLRAARIVLALSNEVREGRQIYSTGESGSKTRILLPDVEAVPTPQWKYLAPRPESSKRQLFLKGRRVAAECIQRSMLANNMTVEEAAADWELPVEVMEEVLRYCEWDKALIDLEADEERRMLSETGIAPSASRKP